MITSRITEGENLKL